MRSSPKDGGLMRSSLIARWMVLIVVVGLVVLGAVTGISSRIANAGINASGLNPEPGAPTVDPTVFDDPAATSTAIPARPTHPVLPEASPLPGSTADAVARQLRNVGPVQGEVWGMVVDAASGQTLYADRPDGVAVPASTQKILTSLAALDIYGPDHRFDTLVRRDPANPNLLYLIGGGDPYLAKGPAGGVPERASILDLAAATADALQRENVTGPVELVVDISLFTGPGWNPAWIPAYRDYAAETTALWVDGARPRGQGIGPRDPDPAKVASDVFTAELNRRGVQVTTTTRGTAPAEAPELAKVRSMPLENIVEQILIHSDNDATEVLFRHVGRAEGRNGSIVDAQAAMQTILSRLGAWSDGMVLADGSGLARTNLTSPAALTHAVELAIKADQPRYRAIATGMSVAGAEGTLGGRFVEDGTGPGRGLVRAKTGTLTRVHSLAGYVRSGDGSILVYSFIVNGEQDEYRTRVWLDRVTAALAACGCHG